MRDKVSVVLYILAINIYTVACFTFDITTSGVDINFQRTFFQHATATKDWVGADGTFSVDMGFGATFFMWQDTWLGFNRFGNDREYNGFTRNTVGKTVIKNGQPQMGLVYAFREGLNLGIVNSMDNSHWEWVAGGVLGSGGKLHLVSGTVTQLANGDVVQTHTGFHCIDNVWSNPLDWDSHDKKTFLPFNDNVGWNGAIAKKDDWVYVMGAINGKTQWDNKAVMSRFRDSDLAECNYGKQECWGYAYGIPAWTGDCSRNNLITMFDVPIETSLHYNDLLQKWVTWQIPLLSREVWIWTSDVPQGPYKGQKVFEAPDWIKNSPIPFMYHPKLHPSLSTNANELVITFSTIASEDYEKKNSWVYVPMPVRFQVKPQSANQSIVVPGTYKLRGKVNGYVIALTDNSGINQWYSFGQDQRWNVTVHDGRYVITSVKSGNALTRENNGIFLRTPNNSSEQKWQLLGTGDDNYYYIVSDKGDLAIDNKCNMEVGFGIPTNVFWNVGYLCQKFLLEKA